LAKAIEAKYGMRPQLIKSGGGAFEVFVGGKKIFSKKETGRFPEHSEILSAIANTRAKE
jgi:selT/selW/selH-like putative selenoprotein